MRSISFIVSTLCLFSFFLLPNVLPVHGMEFDGNTLILPVSPGKKQELYDAALSGDAEGAYSEASTGMPRTRGDSSVLYLEDAISAAVQTHPSIRAAVGLLVQQGYLVSAAKANYFPQIGVEMQTMRESDEDDVSVTPTLYLSQMIYDFGRTKSEVFNARAGLARQTVLAMDQVDNIILQTAEAFINVHHYQEQLKSAEMQIQNVETVVAMAQQRAQSGLTSESDPVQAQTRLEQARANLLTVQTQLSQAGQQLALLTGFQHRGEIGPMDPELFARIGLYNDTDFSNMTVVLLAHSDYNLATAQLDAAKAALYPSIGFVASTGKTLTGNNPNTGFEEDEYNRVGLTVNQSIFQGGRIASQRNAAASAREASFQNLNAAELRAKELIYVARLEIEGLLKKRKILTRRTESIKTTRELYKEQYQLGTRSVLDLLNAEQEYYGAVSEELATEHQYWNNLVSFLILKGEARSIFSTGYLPEEAQKAISGVVPPISENIQEAQGNNAGVPLSE